MGGLARGQSDPKLLLKIIDKCIPDAPRADAVTEVEAQPLPPITIQVMNEENQQGNNGLVGN